MPSPHGRPRGRSSSTPRSKGYTPPHIIEVKAQRAAWRRIKKAERERILPLLNGKAPAQGRLDVAAASKEGKR